METEKENLDQKQLNFVGFIPKKLKLESSPELAIFPLNVLIGRYTVRDGKTVLGSVLYEPDLSSLIITEKKHLVMKYHSRYDHRYFLKMIIENEFKLRRCEKYREKEKIGAAYGVINWENQEESWKNFFMHVALLGLDKGERCQFS
jgi:hypothetical protein